METMRLTLWEGFAHDQGRFLFNELNQDHVLGASMVSVGSYYGTCLSTVGRTRLFIDPDIDETDDLHGWYADDGYVQKHISWSQILTNSISEMEMVFNAKRIKLNQFTAAHNVKYFRVLAKVLSIDSSMPIWYESCAQHLRRADMCVECDPSFSRPRYRINIKIGDATNTMSVTLFGQYAEMIIGCPISSIQAMTDNEFGDYFLEEYLSERLMNTFTFILHVLEIGNDDIIVASVLQVRWEEEFYYLTREMRGQSN
ncbi:replication protein A 70 kDa DNA-binding subunit B-like [Chenopodium quinoa]|uniref:replication protein A 70 kDa DNA-binding subunit B-like n=1 Tax=Chenopodium quinoa TaxID=63459 RepID=UPI000B76DA7A|nr:replication protein A 70 kDa DNA-binding subunit B-like [Chenopodium quinoa]